MAVPSREQGRRRYPLLHSVEPEDQLDWIEGRQKRRVEDEIVELPELWRWRVQCAAADAPQDRRTASWPDPRNEEELTPVVVMFKSIGSAPIMKTNIFKISASNKFQTVTVFLRKQLGLKAGDPLVSQRGNEEARAKPELYLMQGRTRAGRASHHAQIGALCTSLCRVGHPTLSSPPPPPQPKLLTTVHIHQRRIRTDSRRYRGEPIRLLPDRREVDCQLQVCR